MMCFVSVTQIWFGLNANWLPWAGAGRCWGWNGCGPIVHLPDEPYLEHPIPKAGGSSGAHRCMSCPILSSLFPGSPPADAKPVVHVGGEEMNVRAVRSATSQVICTKVWGFSSSSFSRQSCLPSAAFLGRAFADVCGQTCACPACTPSCLALTQGQSWKPHSCISTVQCAGWQLCLSEGLGSALVWFIRFWGWRWFASRQLTE